MVKRLIAQQPLFFRKKNHEYSFVENLKGLWHQKIFLFHAICYIDNNKNM